MEIDVNEIGGPIVLFLLMTAVGLELTRNDFARVFAEPRAVIGGTLGQWILLPLMTWLIVWAFDVSPVFGAGAVILAVSPGAGMSNILAAVARANTALSVTLTATASVFAVVTLPTIASLGMEIFLGEDVVVEVPVGSLFLQLTFSLLVPILVGMTIRDRRPELALRIAPWLLRLTFVAVGIVIVAAIATAPEEQLQFEGSVRATIAAFAWTLSAMAIGWWTARFLGLNDADRFTFLIEFSARNVAVSTLVALSGLGRTDLTFFSGVYFSVGYPLAVGVSIWRRRRVPASTEPADAP